MGVEVSDMDGAPATANEMRLANPPVSEVIISLQFEPITIPLIGFAALVSDFRQDYKGQQDGPGPRGLQLLSEDKSHVLQFEPERLTANWRHREHPYPGNARLHSRFRADLKRFSQYLEQCHLGPLIPRSLLLAYANQVAIPEARSYADLLQEIFPDIGWRRDPNRQLPVPSGINWQTMFHPDPSCVLQVYLQAPALALEGRCQGESVIRFDLVAQGEVSETTGQDEVLDWFSRAHEWILTTFAELTSEAFRSQQWCQSEKGA